MRQPIGCLYLCALKNYVNFLLKSLDKQKARGYNYICKQSEFTNLIKDTLPFFFAVLKNYVNFFKKVLTSDLK
ncbi:hypothetical protein DHL47_12765 [Streptococcus panodentis]|uniref:Uncharacterized protein n=1 Tax=Streptococcus panodentis TaxID=1581472 RepID=A0ABS5B091_9STRE|nr:hypothetical protein [Streptococcus panodentis]